MDKQMGAGGDFARYYVVAHEYGHHVQKLTGMADQVRSAQQQNPREANALQVRMELQADCYAGVWAAKHRDLIEPGDLEEGMTAASAIGDDTLQAAGGPTRQPRKLYSRFERAARCNGCGAAWRAATMRPVTPLPTSAR